MKKLDRLLKRLSEALSERMAVAESTGTNPSDGDSARDKSNTFGGCVFQVGPAKVYMPAYSEEECAGFGGEFTSRQCNDDTEFCYRGPLNEDNRSSGSQIVKAQDCDLRFNDPPQPVFTTPGIAIPSGWYGGGNTCGDPYLGWHPDCRVYFENPVTKNSKAKGVNGFVTLHSCLDKDGNPVKMPEGEVPIPVIPLVIDTRTLPLSPEGSRYPPPGTHLKPGPGGSPRDGGIWRGFRPVATIPNPEFIKYIKEKVPQCKQYICGGSLSGSIRFDRYIQNRRMPPFGGLIVNRCIMSKFGLCDDDAKFEDYFERTFPEIIAGGTGIRDCEKSICSLLEKYISDVESGQDNIYNWDSNYGPEIFDPRTMCPILTGVGNLNPAQEQIKNACAGSMKFLANLFNISKPQAGNHPSGGGAVDPETWSKGCYNCMVWLNPINGQWLPADFPWPRLDGEQLDTLYLLEEQGLDISWFCEQGCNFEALCGIEAP
jgi:hypothetical protein